MADFGICENPDCELSYCRPSLAGLFRQIAAANNMETRQADISGVLPFLKHFEPFSQFRIECVRCGRFLYRVTQPTADLQTESEEYIRRSKLNALLSAPIATMLSHQEGGTHEIRASESSRDDAGFSPGVSAAKTASYQRIPIRAATLTIKTVDDRKGNGSHEHSSNAQTSS